MKGKLSSVLFENIMRSHWNINAAREVREKQKEDQKVRREAMLKSAGMDGKEDGTNGVVAEKPLSG